MQNVRAWILLGFFACGLSFFGCEANNPSLAETDIESSRADGGVQATMGGAIRGSSEVDGGVVSDDATPPGLPPRPMVESDASVLAMPPPGPTAGETSAPMGGTVDSSEASPPVAMLRLNEIQCRDDEWVEILNMSDGIVALDGWSVVDRREDEDDILELPSIELGPGDFWASPTAGGLPFGVGCDGDTVFLRDPLGRIADEIEVAAPSRGLTWGRLPDGNGSWQETTPTPGQPNQRAAEPVIRINEIDCRGRDRLEIINLTDRTVDLTGWQIDDDVELSDNSFELNGRIEPDEIEIIRQQTSTDIGFTFGIGCSEDTIALFNPAGELVDSIQVQPVVAAYTWGRLPDGDGDWQTTEPTFGGANSAPAETEAPLFDASNVLEIDLIIDEAGRDQLSEDGREYVPAQFKVRSIMDEPIAIGLRIKGRIGSRREIDDKPGWKIKFDFVEMGQRFLGLERLTLNNMVQDRAQIHEWTAYTIFRALGLAAPRVGYAFVRLNGEIYGVYTIIEPPDRHMLDRWFYSTRHLYEGAYGQDLISQQIDRFEVDIGNENDRSDLRSLQVLLDTTPPRQFYEVSQGRIDWESVLVYMATEVYIGHWDGYAPTRNNYYFHFDDDGVLSLLPWGTDQTFEGFIDFRNGRGRLFEACRASPICQVKFDQALVTVMQVIDQIGLVEQIPEIAESLRPWQEIDTKSGRDQNALDNQVMRTINFLNQRKAAALDALACVLDPEADADEDGLICQADCNPMDPTIFYGAPDVCGDGIDQDCSGRADDGPECPDCIRLAFGDHAYWACPKTRNYEESVAICAAEGAIPVTLDTPQEAAWLRRTIRQINGQDYWIGLTDRDIEGEFVWADARPVGDYRAWFGNEPNGGQRENCVGLRMNGGGWYDRACGDRLGVICEAECDGQLDTDEDGVSACEGDCDDNDPSRGPNQPEICGDGIDNDCDLNIDEGQNCPCKGRIRDGRTYRFCLDGQNWVEASDTCRERDLALVVVNDAEENDWIVRASRSIANTNWWLGASDIDTEGSFLWVDESAVMYANWNEGEPNNFRRSEDCMEMVQPNGKWNDRNCGADLPYICEPIDP